MNDQYYLSVEEPCQGCLLALRDIILGMDTRITETKKYGAPCFLLDKRIMCYLWIDKKTRHPYILLNNGNALQHPALERGDRKRMKILPINPNEDLPLEVINEILEEAILVTRLSR
jgi:hypothetical protein